ncbi:unnamed protein product [Rotaria sp. Silwood2]|nr:unnamed protein product [Rotaria sp. Silwood2]CAF3205756.1 unnamed protein product [Rotaria sp. Silwood2]
MNRSNIRTVNGAKHNGHLEHRYKHVQNRAAAVIDAWNELEDEESIDLIAHLHRISIDQIKNDLLGEPLDIKRRFGIASTDKLEQTLRKCLKEINEGVNHALVAVANHVPFRLLCSVQNNGNIREIATIFLSDVRKKFKKIDSETTAVHTDKPVEKSTTLKLLNKSPFRSIENQPIIATSPERKEQCNNIFFIFSCCHVSCSLASSTRPYHTSHAFSQSDLKMRWIMLNGPGCGLNNHDEFGKSKNICYINAIIQCLANMAPFVQWLLENSIPNHC